MKEDTPGQTEVAAVSAGVAQKWLLRAPEWILPKNRPRSVFSPPFMTGKGH